MNDIYIIITIVTFGIASCFSMYMLGKIFFLVIVNTSIDFFESSYINPLYNVWGDMLFTDLIIEMGFDWYDLAE